MRAGERNDGPAEVELHGAGPFLLPICEAQIDILRDERLVVFQLTTMEGQRLVIPFRAEALANIAAVTAAALAAQPEPA